MGSCATCASTGDPLNPFIEYGVVNAQVMADHQQGEESYFWLGERPRNVAEPRRGQLHCLMGGGGGVYPTLAYTKYTTISHKPGSRVWGVVEKVYTPNANQKRLFSKHRASIRNQHPRNTCSEYQRNHSVFLMKPRVYKPKQMGGSWDSNGGWFSLPCFLK